MAEKVKSTKISLLVFVVALFYFVAPIESMAIVNQFSLPKLMAIVVIVVRVFTFKPIKVSRSQKTFIPLLLYALLSILWSIDVDNSLRSVFLFLIPSLLVMEAIDSSIDSEKEIRLYLASYALGTVITIVLALINRDQVISDAEFVGEERLSVFGQDQNTYAFLVNMAIVIILNFYRQVKKRILKHLFLIILLSAAFVIVSTGSRTGLFVLALTMLLFVFSSDTGFSKIGFVILMVAFIIILLPLIPQETLDRFSESGDLISEGDFSQRGIIWRRALKCFNEENFLFGVGYSNFSTMLAKHYGGWMMASHNTYLTYFVEFGAVGMITFIYVLLAIIRSVIRIYRKERNVFIFSFVFPLFITMFLLETEYKRWIFMLAVLLFNYERLITFEGNNT